MTGGKGKRNQFQCVGIKPNSVLPQEGKKERKQTSELLQKEKGHLRCGKMCGSHFAANTGKKSFSFLNWETFSVVAADYLEDSYLF